MKYSVLAGIALSALASAETLTTPHHVVYIERGCEEGEVTCDRVRITYVSVGLEDERTVVGRTVHTMCADGVTPCAFQGYEFVGVDGRTYFIHQAGTLIITDGDGRQRVVEPGKWGN